MSHYPRRTAALAGKVVAVTTVVAALTTVGSPALAGYRSCNRTTGVCTIRNDGLTQNTVRGANYTVDGDVQVYSDATVSPDKQSFTFSFLGGHVAWFVAWDAGVSPPPMDWDLDRRVTFNGATSVSTSTSGWGGSASVTATESTTRGASGNALYMTTRSSGWVQLPICKWIYDPGPVLLANGRVQSVTYHATSRAYFPDAPFTLTVADDVSVG